ncbi:MAG: Lrp/AsnC family transcriptional regulator [Candidatus Bathyarchaeota archaeon]|nr:Lrp/AsnC family transcriptional regulator [Candidatus Bathyarchaeota archaeon]
MTRRDDLELRALKLILEKGDEGILQRDMWRKLNATSREGSRISLRLEAKNLIRRERELANGRWTNRIFINVRRVELDSILDVPCMVCEDIQNCEVGGEISASNCDVLTQWLASHSRNTAQAS